MTHTLPVTVDRRGRMKPVSAGPLPPLLKNPVPDELRRESFVDERAESVVVPLDEDRRPIVACGG